MTQSRTEPSCENEPLPTVLTVSCLTPCAGSCGRIQSSRLAWLRVTPLKVLPMSALESTAAAGLVLPGSGARSGWAVSNTRQKPHMPEK